MNGLFQYRILRFFIRQFYLEYKSSLRWLLRLYIWNRLIWVGYKNTQIRLRDNIEVRLFDDRTWHGQDLIGEDPFELNEFQFRDHNNLPIVSKNFVKKSKKTLSKTR